MTGEAKTVSLRAVEDLPPAVRDAFELGRQKGAAEAFEKAAAWHDRRAKFLRDLIKSGGRGTQKKRELLAKHEEFAKHMRSWARSREHD